jgi:predicted phosphodiesterase
VSRIKKAIVLPDIHIPYHDERTLRNVMRYIDDSRPDTIVILGDLLDFRQISRFSRDIPEDLTRSLDEDYQIANAWLDRLEGILPKTRVVLIEGNHEYRVVNLAQKFPQLAGLVEVPSNLHLSKRGKRYRWVPYWSEGELYQIGNAYFGHGRFISKYHAFRHVDRYGVNFFYGHTHDVMSFPKVLAGADKTLVGQSLGCLCQYEQDYLRGAPTNWQQAFGEFHFRPSGFFNHYVISIFDGAFTAPSGVTYQS